MAMERRVQRRPYAGAEKQAIRAKFQTETLPKRAEDFFHIIVDMILCLDYIPMTSSQPRARSRALETRGRPEVGIGDAVPKPSGSVRGHPGRLGRWP